ncbi:MAG: TfoX/Sxy family protein [Ilumatobacter sp.]|uniref:TfoX/Sxy family protein n=1 Tax=Ilumatobacter sp. TaxID=1967498 RepID=UPI003C769035
MAFDDALAERVRERLDGEDGVTERRMFGGIAFLVDGHMAVVVSGRGGLMVRADPVEAAKLVADGPARYAEMRGREMTAWLRVDDEVVADEEALFEWVDRGVASARVLPPKP